MEYVNTIPLNDDLTVFREDKTGGYDKFGKPVNSYVRFECKASIRPRTTRNQDGTTYETVIYTNKTLEKDDILYRGLIEETGTIGDTDWDSLTTWDEFKTWAGNRFLTEQLRKVVKVNPMRTVTGETIGTKIWL